MTSHHAPRQPSPQSFAIRVGCLALAALVGCPAPATRADDAGTNGAADAAAVADAAVAVDAATDAPPIDAFVVAPHDPFPQVSFQGGPVLAHPRLVVVTYADDPNRAAIEADARWIVGSSWLTTAGAEYGVGAGSVLATVERADDAPAVLDDVQLRAQIAQGLADGSLPGATVGAAVETQPLYVFYFPQHTTVSQQGEHSCGDFAGFHDELVQGGYDVTYAVVVTCAWTPPITVTDGLGALTAHELFEAATDPSPERHPAYALPQSALTSPWQVVVPGGELGDLCDFWNNWYRDGDFVVQRVWSNQAALRGDEDPCVPAPAGTPFYDTSVAPGSVQSVAAGASVVFTLTGWSSGPVPAWQVQAATLGGSFVPGIALDATHLSNGVTTTLRLTVPASAAHGDSASVVLYSAHSESDYVVTPIVIDVP